MNQENEVLRKMFFKFIYKVASFARIDYLRSQSYRNRHEITSADLSGNAKQMVLGSDDLQDSEDIRSLSVFGSTLLHGQRKRAHMSGI